MTSYTLIRFKVDADGIRAVKGEYHCPECGGDIEVDEGVLLCLDCPWANLLRD